MAVRLTYSEEHDLLREEARRFLADRFPITRVRELTSEARAPEASSKIVPELAQLGWLGLVLPEEHGGAGLGFTHLAVLLEEVGRALVPAPLLSSTLAGLAILHGGSDEQQADLLPGIIAGETLATLAYVDADGAWDFRATSATRSDGRLRGVKHHVWDGATADLFVVPLREDGVLQIAVVDARAEGVVLTSDVVLDRTRPSSRVEFSDVALSEDRILERGGEVVADAILAQACTALAAEQIGGADALLAMTAEYAATRQQFGKPIGAFQAVKHPLVNVLIAVEQGRSLVYAAASALDAGAAAEDGEALELARMAKAHASDAYVFAASRSIQLHGGFGFTLDCDAHLYFKRAQVSRAAWGDAVHHRAAIGARLCRQA